MRDVEFWVKTRLFTVIVRELLLRQRLTDYSRIHRTLHAFEGGRGPYGHWGPRYEKHSGPVSPWKLKTHRKQCRIREQRTAWLNNQQPKLLQEEAKVWKRLDYVNAQLRRLQNIQVIEAPLVTASEEAMTMTAAPIVGKVLSSGLFKGSAKFGFRLAGFNTIPFTRELFELLLIDKELFLTQVTAEVVQANNLQHGYASHCLVLSQARDKELAAVARLKFEHGQRWNKVERRRSVGQ